MPLVRNRAPTLRLPSPPFPEVNVFASRLIPYTSKSVHPGREIGAAMKPQIHELVLTSSFGSSKRPSDRSWSVSGERSSAPSRCGAIVRVVGVASMGNWELGIGLALTRVVAIVCAQAQIESVRRSWLQVSDAAHVQLHPRPGADGIRHHELRSSDGRGEGRARRLERACAHGQIERPLQF